ncbi:MAG: glycosyltransferase family 4 protein [Chitinophagaceae bacterium]|nr:glycosyltransferase family 4 protein [Chitinophagaceae bacterium]
MKVGFAGRWNPLDKTAWSGTYFHSYNAIKKHYPVETFYYKWPWHVRESLILHKQFQKLIHKKAAVEFLTGYAKYFSKQLEKEILKRKVDVLFVPSAPQLIAYCKTSIPVIYMTDATFFQLQGYYPLFKDIAPYNINQGLKMDKLTFENAAHCMVASEWTKQSAINDYKISTTKLTVAPLGANLDKIPALNEINTSKNNICQLLFLGVEWERKGGQIALDTFYKLKEAGLPVQLTIIGCVPPVRCDDKDITVIPFINKHNSEEAVKLYNIICNSNFLLLPTRAECAGVVFCEASAFGVPSITTNTGGVSTYVEDGVNGFALPVNATANEYAQKIQSLFVNENTYNQLCLSSRKKYEDELNWDSWGKAFSIIAEQILNK